MFFRLARRAAFAVALFAASFSAFAQTFPTVPSGTVIGRTLAGTGPAQAIPFSTLIALMLQSSLTTPTINTNTVIYRGATSGQATVSAQSVAGTPSIKWPTTSGTVPSTATAPILLDAVTGAISCPTCATSTAAASPIVASRPLAQTLNLSSFAGLVTVGYTAAGDGGGATFKNVGTAAFLDSFVTNGSITAAGSAYTNGTYRGVYLTGGTGTGLQANITVAGGVVTTVSLAGNGGNGYTAGNVLSATAASIGGTGSGFTWTVSTVSTPTGSFTDAVGTHFQLVVDQGNTVGVRQFGAKVDYNVTAGDAGSTNDTVTIQNALNFCARILPPTVDAYGLAGTTCMLPRGYALAGALTIPFGVRLKGEGAYSSGLKMAGSLGDASQWISMCDSTTQLACFGSFLSDMTLIHNGSGSAAASTALVYSGSIQQMNFLERVQMFGGTRSCVFLDHGYGGAAQVGMSDFDCVINGTTNAGIKIDLGGSQTLVNIQRGNVQAGGAGVANSGILIAGGFVEVTTMHFEGVSTGIFLNVPVNSGVSGFHNISGGAHCTNLILRQSGSAANVNVAGRLNPNGCTNTINNAGAATTGYVVTDVTF